MSVKVMLVYPNLKGMNMIPPAMGLLSAVLKREGCQVKLFDTTYYDRIEGKTSDSDKSKSDRLMARPYEMPKQITNKITDCFEDFVEEFEEYQPDLMAMSATEDMFPLGVKLLKKINKNNCIILVGGVFATFAPDLVFKNDEVDIVCVGEGEDALTELCKRIKANKTYDDIPNLWVRQKDGDIKQNQLKVVDIEKNPLIDMSIFEEARYYRPMGGKVYRMFPVETNRGCPYTCTYCNSPQKIKMHKECGQMFIRRKSFKKIREELIFYKNVMKAEYLYFWADTFFSWRKGEFEQFVEIYKDIDLPFWCQTRIETITLENMKKLKDVGCARMSFGVEHGNEKFRKEILKRNISNETIVKNLKCVSEAGITYSVNNMMGFPHETPELAFDTIRLNKQFDAADRNAYPFAPFHGTPLREEC